MFAGSNFATACPPCKDNNDSLHQNLEVIIIIRYEASIVNWRCMGNLQFELKIERSRRAETDVSCRDAATDHRRPPAIVRPCVTVNACAAVCYCECAILEEHRMALFK
jgi:hypothetical protein